MLIRMIHPMEILPITGKILSWCTSVLFAHCGQKIHSISRKLLFYRTYREVVSVSYQAKWVSMTLCRLEKEQNHKKLFYFSWPTLKKGYGTMPRSLLPSSFGRLSHRDDFMPISGRVLGGWRIWTMYLRVKTPSVSAPRWSRCSGQRQRFFWRNSIAGFRRARL